MNTLKKIKSCIFFNIYTTKRNVFQALNCFSILDLATTNYQTKLKEGMFIDWEKPNLNKQTKKTSVYYFINLINLYGSFFLPFHLRF